MVGIMIYNNSYRTDSGTKGPEGWKGWLEELFCDEDRMGLDSLKRLIRLDTGYWQLVASTE